VPSDPRAVDPPGVGRRSAAEVVAAEVAVVAGQGPAVAPVVSRPYVVQRGRLWGPT